MKVLGTMVAIQGMGGLRMAKSVPLILVVDDESLLRSMLTQILKRLDYESVAVHSAEAAMGVLKSQSFDLALLDISLPGKSGVDLLEHVAESYPDTAVIMVTGNDELTTALQTLRSGAYDYVAKPFQEDELATCIERALETRRLKMENRQYQLNLEQLVSDRTQALEQALGRLGQTYDQTIRALGAALDLRDTETEDHCVRVANYSVHLARVTQRCDEVMLRNLKWGAYLHDIGKIGVPDAILLKPDLLTESEYGVIKRHPELGYRMLSGIPFLTEATEVVYCHHEEYDGSGYPRGLSGNDIPLAARIFAVADAVDAMTSNRSYRDALSWVEIKAELRSNSGKQFDPDVVDAFLSVPIDEWAAIREGAANDIPESSTPVGSGV